MTAIPGGAWNQKLQEGTYSPISDQRYGPFDKGLIDLSEILAFGRRNLLRISIVTIVLTLCFLVLFSLYPFPYRATALVLVDPRERRVTLTENVLAGIGSDAAFLESVVQIVHSDGFLQPVLEELEVKNDPLFAGAGNSDSRKMLAAFRKNLEVDRIGATFIVEISFKSPDAEKSALYANAIAQAFVDSQARSFVSANESAASSLQERLNVLQKNLETSENAVARFKAKNGIINVAQDSTLLQRELITLNERLVIARAETEAARARIGKIRAGSGFSPAVEQSDIAQLVELRRQRGQVLQNLSEFGRVYGERHPQVTSERSKLAGLERQIVDEQNSLLAIQKEQLESSVSALQALEDELKQSKKTAVKTERATVQLASLEREAAANRRLYEEFLARFKATEEQSGIEPEQAQIASPALPPLHTIRPSRFLAAIVFGLFSGFCALAYAVLRETTFSTAGARTFPRLQRLDSGRRTISMTASTPFADPENAVTKLHATIKKTGFLGTNSVSSSAGRLQGTGHVDTSRSGVDGSLDPIGIAQSLEVGPLRNDLRAMLQPGSVVVIGSPATRHDQSSLALGIAALAVRRSVPVLLLTGNHTLSNLNRSDLDTLRFPKNQPMSIVSPTEITAKHFGNRRSIWEIVEGFSVSNTGRDSCMIVDAPPVTHQGQIQRLVGFADYFVLLESANEPEHGHTEVLLDGLSYEAQEKLRRILL
jgi:uncharacterized protein involved in exopolysaccharide biosynthesis